MPKLQCCTVLAIPATASAIISYLPFSPRGARAETNIPSVPSASQGIDDVAEASAGIGISGHWRCRRSISRHRHLRAPREAAGRTLPMTIDEPCRNRTEREIAFRFRWEQVRPATAESNKENNPRRQRAAFLVTRFDWTNLTSSVCIHRTLH
jgi:hypothetical protein